jgi:hypothetical protein
MLLVLHDIEALATLELLRPELLLTHDAMDDAQPHRQSSRQTDCEARPQTPLPNSPFLSLSSLSLLLSLLVPPSHCLPCLPQSQRRPQASRSSQPPCRLAPSSATGSSRACLRASQRRPQASSASLPASSLLACQPAALRPRPPPRHGAAAAPMPRWLSRAQRSSARPRVRGRVGWLLRRARRQGGSSLTDDRPAGPQASVVAAPRLAKG